SIRGKNIFIATTDTNWQTPYGIQLADKNKIQKILNFPKVSLNYQVFTNEHSIYVLVPFIKKVFPQAKIVPIIVRNNLDYKYFYNFGKNLSSKKSLLIISSDFSHYSTPEQCQQNDTQSVNLLYSQEFNQSSNVNCDCTQCINLLYGFLSNIDTSFELVENKKSTDFGEKNLENITSYISAYYIKK
ncbi:AmmeMemoRadiSam system protein B, partial [Candidatus Shapirobacteria bacterium]